MNKNIKNFLTILVVFALVVGCFAALPWTANAATPEIPGDSTPLPLRKGQAPIYLDGKATDRLTAVYNGNSPDIPGWNKISGNGKKVSITVDELTVGYFVFDKKGNAPSPYQDFLKIEIYQNLPAESTITIRWDCSKYYAYADLSTPGTYYIPQLMQDNGKIQSFNQIWFKTTYTPQNPDQYTITIEKTINGQPLLTWYSNYHGDIPLADFIAGMNFNLCPVADRGARVESSPIAAGKCTLSGTIDLTFNVATKSLSGWYAIVEDLTGVAADYFEKPEPTYIYLGKNNIASNFDYNAFYKLDHNLANMLLLGYAGLNNGGEIFPITVTNVNTGVTYPSFCANTLSVAFAEDHNYVVATNIEEDLPNWKEFLAAYNYIEDNIGNLADNRAITQTVTWALLGAIDVNSDAFGATNLMSSEKVAVKDVIANFLSYPSSNKIVDVAFMVCENHPEHSFVQCQPQIVPVYRYAFNNEPIADPGTITLQKIVAGQTIRAWASLQYDDPMDRTDILSGITFALYGPYTACNGYDAADFIAQSVLDENSNISFDVPNRQTGWYAVVERLSGKAANIFMHDANNEVVWYIYYLEDGKIGDITCGTVASIISSQNIAGDFYVSATGGRQKSIQIVYEDDATIQGIKPDGSNQALNTWGFETLMPDGTTVPSFCADLGAHQVWGVYKFDSDRHNLNDEQILRLIAALDYLNDQYDINTPEGYALCQLVIWNAILATGDEGYAVTYRLDHTIIRIQGYNDGNDNWYTADFKNCVDDILANPDTYVDRYNAKIANTHGIYVSGIIWVVGNDPTIEPINQQRQMLLLFGDPAFVNNIVIVNNNP